MKTTAMLAAFVSTLCIASQSQAELVTAGELIVDLRGADLAPGITNWVNHATSTNSVGDFMQLDQGVLNVINSFGDSSNTYANALHVDAVLGNSVVSELATPSVLESNSTRSAEAWIYAESLPSESTVIGWGNNGDQKMCSLRYHGGDNGMYSGWWADAGWSVTPPTGSWVYAVWTYDGATGEVKGYLNGVMVSASSLPELLTSHFRIGIGSERDGSNGAFDGYISDVRVHAGLLSEADVLNNYNEGIIDPPTSLAPVITGLEDTYAYIGQDVMFEPLVTGGLPLSYQWTYNSDILASATNSTLTLTNVQATANGSIISLIATNPYGVETNSITLTVGDVPDIGPVTINFDVNRGSGTYSGTAIAGGTGSSWNGWGDSSYGAGPYVIDDIVDSHGNVLDPVQITVDGSSCRSWSVSDASAGNPNPVLLMQDYIWEGSHTITVSGLPDGEYDLYVYAHGDVTGQASTITVSPTNGGAMAFTTDIGEYRNIYGTNALSNAYVVVEGSVSGTATFSFDTQYLNGFQLQSAIPVIEGLGGELTVTAGTNLVVDPGVAGRSPSYEWSLNDAVVSTDAQLSLSDVQAAQGGEYTLVVSNSLGSDTNSFTLVVESGVVGPITIDSIAVADGTASISWSSDAGSGYAIESSSDLSADSWTTVTNLDSVGSQTTDIPATGDAEFFRITN